MINRTILVGRLTKDPELRKTQSGLSVTSFTVAVNRRKKEDGTQEADFINAIVWRGGADFISQYGRKGALVGIDGRIQTRSYDDSNGKKVYVTEVLCDSVQLLESKATSESRTNDYTNEYVEDTVHDYQEVPILDIDSSELPF